ncbi:unnamed protein product [Bursaphelenchus xylophilus]|uniref:(pine wood nematode) hypothetical protein n=1 Tax=Bursaphelenchus xylophilus TaxID=6326 RepID=A0A1I7SKK9_BURXY|nr:unnamed protein product [Bursaphelenchus xylophilus]CAG9128430.1 unnamed protein product [Bursaphelenchus xylophilus]
MADLAHQIGERSAQRRRLVHSFPATPPPISLEGRAARARRLRSGGRRTWSMEEAWSRLSRRLTAPCAIPVDFSAAACLQRSFLRTPRPAKRVRREYYVKNVMYNS